MAHDDDTAGAAGGQPGFPNLRAGADGWAKGQSGNPTGVSKYQALLRRAIEAQESPAMVCEVVQAMREQAKSQTKASPAAAMAYFKAVGLRLDGGAAINLPPDAPDEVVEYLMGLVH